MTAASFHTASLNTTPINRKTTLMTALSDMLDTIGFGTQVDAYDITDEGTWQFTAASRASVEASKTGSLVAVVREVVHSVGKTFGTVHYVFFSRAVADAEYGGTEWVTGVETYTPRFVLGVCAVVGGWDSVNHKPTSTAFANGLGGYAANFPITQSYAIASTSLLTKYNNGQGMTALGHQFAGPAASTMIASTDINTWPLSENSRIYLIGVNHTEMQGVYVYQQGAANYFLGYMRPANKPTWWNEDTYPYTFVPMNTSFLMYRGFARGLSPFDTSTITTTAAVYSECNLAVPFYTGQVGVKLAASSKIFPTATQAVSKPSLMSDSGHILGSFSSDLVITAYAENDLMDKLVVTASVEEYRYLTTRLQSQFWFRTTAINTPPTGLGFAVALRSV